MIKKIKHHIGNFMPALRSANYRLYFIGQTISMIGTWFSSIASQWLIYPTLTNNQAMLGIVSIAGNIPITLLTLYAGVLADRSDKKKLVIVLQMLLGLISLAGFFLILNKIINIYHVFVGAILSGLIVSFDMPARNAMISEVVEKKDYPSAISLNSGIFNAARAIGPAFAGILIAAVGIAPAYLIDAVSYGVVVICLIIMKTPNIIKQNKNISIFKGLKEGISYLRVNYVMLVMMVMVGLITLFTWPRTILTPVFAHDIFKKGEVGFGMLQSFFGIGAVIAALSFYKIFEKTKNKFNLLTLALSATVLSQIFFALTKYFWLALIFQIIGGLGMVFFNTTVNTITQLISPDHLRGRMISFFTFFMIGAMPLGGLLSSVGVIVFGPKTTLVFCAIMLALIGYISLNKIRQKLAKMI